MSDEAVSVAKEALLNTGTVAVQQLREALDGPLGDGWLAAQDDRLESALYAWGLTADDLPGLAAAAQNAPYDEGQALVAWFADLANRAYQVQEEPVATDTGDTWDDAGYAGPDQGAPEAGSAWPEAGAGYEIQQVAGFADWWAVEATPGGEWLYVQSAYQPNLDSPGWVTQETAFALMGQASAPGADAQSDERQPDQYQPDQYQYETPEVPGAPAAAAQPDADDEFLAELLMPALAGIIDDPNLDNGALTPELLESILVEALAQANADTEDQVAQ